MGREMTQEGEGEALYAGREVEGETVETWVMDRQCGWLSLPASLS